MGKVVSMRHALRSRPSRFLDSWTGRKPRVLAGADVLTADGSLYFHPYDGGVPFKVEVR